MHNEITLSILLILFYLLFNSYKNRGENPLISGYNCCRNSCAEIYNGFSGGNAYLSSFQNSEHPMTYHVDDDELNNYSHFCNNVFYDGNDKAYYVTDKVFDQTSNNSEYTSLANFSTDQVKTTFKMN